MFNQASVTKSWRGVREKGGPRQGWRGPEGLFDPLKRDDNAAVSIERPGLRVLGV